MWVAETSTSICMIVACETNELKATSALRQFDCAKSMVWITLGVISIRKAGRRTTFWLNIWWAMHMSQIEWLMSYDKAWYISFPKNNMVLIDFIRTKRWHWFQIHLKAIVRDNNVGMHSFNCTIIKLRTSITFLVMSLVLSFVRYWKFGINPALNGIFARFPG